MASNKSYYLTRLNNKTEKDGIDYLVENDSCIWSVQGEDKKNLMDLFGINKRFNRSFDLIRIEGTDNSQKLKLTDEIDITFIELKTTKKYLKDFPRGFFFGATENEFQLAKELGNKYKFCFVSLHENSQKHCYLSLEEVEKIIKTKRIQYQINL